MGRKSVKENKNIYQISREEMNLTREAAAELLGFISADRIEKIESGKAAPHPDEVLRMAKCYRNAWLCNEYCSKDCEIGRVYSNPAEKQDISQIVLRILASLNDLQREKDRLIEITADGKISEEEMDDFLSIKGSLNKMSATIDSLKLWVSDMSQK